MQFAIKALSQFHLQRFVEAGDHHNHRKWGDGQGPADAPAVVVLLDGGLGQPGDPDAVAAHPEGFFLAGLSGEGGLEGLRIFAAQLKDVAHFDAAGGF